MSHSAGAPWNQADQQDPGSVIDIQDSSSHTKNKQQDTSQSDAIRALKRSHFLKVLESMAAVATYCLSAISATILNRYVLSDLRFGMNALLLIFQWIISIIFLLLLRSTGLIDFKILKAKQVLTWLPVSIGISAMTYSGSKCLEHCAISIVTIFKNTSILLVAFGDLCFFERKISLLTYFSFVLIILSSLLGIYGDTKVTRTGMLWLLINCMATAMYVLFLKGTRKKMKFNDFDTVFNNSLLSIPLMLVISFLFDAWDKFLSYEANPFVRGGLGTVLSVFGCAFSTFMTAIGTAWVVRITSPTTYSMTAALNKLPMSLGGMLFLRSERHVTKFNIMGIICGFISGVVYSISMVRESKKAHRKKAKEIFELSSANAQSLQHLTIPSPVYLASTASSSAAPIGKV